MVPIIPKTEPISELINIKTVTLLYLFVYNTLLLLIKLILRSKSDEKGKLNITYFKMLCIVPVVAFEYNDK